MTLITTSPLNRPQVFVGLIGLCALGLSMGQPAKAVTVSLSSAQAPFICPSGVCVFDVLTTSDVPPGPGPFPSAPITYATLSSGSYPLNGYNYQFNNASAASAFATAYNASDAPNILKESNANSAGLGEVPANPDRGGGPLFFTGVGIFSFPLVGTLTTANGQYFTGNASNNFNSNISGTGSFAGTVPQLQVWGLYKCTSGSCAPGIAVPAPLPMLGIGAAFGYSRRLRHRLNRQLG
jgi:hypothetical protein